MQPVARVWMRADARPFRPFAILMNDGRRVEVWDPRCLAMDPQERVLIVVQDVARLEYLFAAEVAGVEDAAAPGEGVEGEPEANEGEEPRILARSEAEALVGVALTPQGEGTGKASAGRGALREMWGGLWLEVHAEDAFRRVTHRATVRDAGGRVVFSTLGTRWNLAGVSKEASTGGAAAGLKVWLSHVDDPLLYREVVVWGDGRAEMVGEMPESAAGDARRGLVELDDAASARAREGPVLALGVHEPRGMLAPPEPRVLYHRGEELVEPARERGAEAFEIRLKPRVARLGEAGADVEEGQQMPSVVDRETGEEVLALSPSAWWGEAELAAGPWGKVWALRLSRPELSRPGGMSLEVHVRPEACAARVVGLTVGEVPVTWLQWQLLGMELHGDEEAMARSLREGPRDLSREPLAWVERDGWRFEWWAALAKSRHGHPESRVIGPEGRCVLDLRSTAWTLALWPRDVEPRGETSLCLVEKMDAARRLTSRWMTLEARTGRVRYLAGPGLGRSAGSTVIEALQALAISMSSYRSLGFALDAAVSRGAVVEDAQG